MSCPICLETFENPQILNCGHSYCLRCIESLKQHSPLTASCPECRQRILRYTPNYSLNSENNYQDINNNITQNEMNLNKKNKFVIHDNSGSMRTQDASLLYFHSDGKIESKNYCYRYQEANQRTNFIVQQTIEENGEVTIYLLNPISEDDKYIDGEDYVTINKQNYNKKKHILEKILNPSNIYGMTPLAKVTRKIKNEIINNKNKKIKHTIIFNTDGEPNNGWHSNEKHQFEIELKQLISKVPCELIFNIITDEEKVVEYYNDLDINLNKGMEEITPIVDILDDFKSESIEVHRVNPWLTYSIDIHKKRISGGNHITFDMIDEGTMDMFYTNIFIKIILDRNDIPDVDDPNYFSFLENIVKDNKVYDITQNDFKPIVNINALKIKYYYEKTIKNFSKQLNNHKITIMITLFFLVTTLLSFNIIIKKFLTFI